MSKANCYGCQNNIANQLGHMDPGGCLYTKTLGDEIDEALELYEEFTDLERNGPPPMPNYHDNIGWEEANFDGMVDAMMDELESARSNLTELCEQAKGTEYERMAKDAYDVVLSNQQSNLMEAENCKEDTTKSSDDGEKQVCDMSHETELSSAEALVIHLMSLTNEKEGVLAIEQKKLHDKRDTVVVIDDLMELLIKDVVSSQMLLKDAENKVKMLLKPWAKKEIFVQDTMSKRSKIM